jgi:hypothetical protein
MSETHGHCTIKCPAIRDDKGSFYCYITQSSVAPYEHREDYGFDIVKEGKITHSGYHTPCKVMVIFPHLHIPAPEHNELSERECAINNCLRKDWMQRHDAAIVAQERERILELLHALKNKLSDAEMGDVPLATSKKYGVGRIAIEGAIKLINPIVVVHNDR